MQRTASYFRWILISRAVWNFYVSSAVVLGVAWPALAERMGFRVPSPAMWFLLSAGSIFISGVLNLMASRNRVDYRPVLYFDIAGRALYILTYAVYAARGHGHWLLTMIATGDLLMIVLGLDFLRHYPKLAAGSARAQRA